MKGRRSKVVTTGRGCVSLWLVGRGWEVLRHEIAARGRRTPTQTYEDRAKVSIKAALIGLVLSASQVSALVVEGTVTLAMDDQPVANARVQFARESSRFTYATMTGNGRFLPTCAVEANYRGGIGEPAPWNAAGCGLSESIQPIDTHSLRPRPLRPDSAEGVQQRRPADSHPRRREICTRVLGA